MILGLRLRQMREACGLKGRQVVEKYLTCSTSKLFMIESGTRKIGRLELTGLVSTAYNRTELAQRMEDLRQQVANGDAGLVRDHPTLHPHVMLVHELEKEATEAYGLQIDQIPKLWQNKEYMMRQHRMSGSTGEEIERLTLAGIDRQHRFLDLDNPPYTTVIITEAALDRAATVPGQLEFIQHQSTHPSLVLRAIPTGSGPHPSYAGFTVMKFDEFPNTLWADTVHGGSLTHEPDEVAHADNRWTILSQYAATPEETLDMVRSRMTQ